MYEYIKGIIKDIDSNYIVLDNNGIGYVIYLPNPYVYNIEEEKTVFVYQHLREDENTLYGFKNIEEKKLFLKLINVKGLGPKMALPMLATGSINGIIDAIERENLLYLKKFPKIGEKLAKQIILDLKGKLKYDNKTIDQDNDELISVLKGLGYKNSDITAIVKQIDFTIPIEEQVKVALKLLLK